MRAKACLCIILVIVFLIAAWGIKIYFFPDAYGHMWTPLGISYLRGIRLGVAQAKEDIRKQEAMILNPVDASEEHVDRTTGLYLWTMGWDVHDRGTEGYVAGYNSTVHAFIKKNGIPSYSWKKWESVIFDASGYFDKGTLSNEPLTLRQGDDVIKSPDSNTLISLRTNRTGDIYLICLGPSMDNCDTIWPVSPINGDLKCIWGPSGSNLLFMRGLYARSKIPVTGVFDLRGRRSLQFDYDREKFR